MCQVIYTQVKSLRVFPLPSTFQLPSKAQAAAQGQMPDASKKKVDTVHNMARKLQYSRAMHILRSPGCSTAPLEEILQQLENLHANEEVDLAGRSRRYA